LPGLRLSCHGPLRRLIERLLRPARWLLPRLRLAAGLRRRLLLGPLARLFLFPAPPRFFLFLALAVLILIV
jgi:hypothetical protein